MLVGFLLEFPNLTPRVGCVGLLAQLVEHPQAGGQLLLVRVLAVSHREPMTNLICVSCPWHVTLRWVDRCEVGTRFSAVGHPRRKSARLPAPSGGKPVPMKESLERERKSEIADELKIPASNAPPPDALGT